MRLFTLLLGMSLPISIIASEPEHGGGKQGPREVLWRLRQGNRSYAAGQVKPAHATASRRAQVVAGQHPKAVILTCADSRVPPEYIFNEGIGDLFVVRVAGVVADPVVTGSVEYAAEHLHVPLVVVMGHTRCGAVKAAMDTPEAPPPGGPGANIESILALLRPGIGLRGGKGDPWRAAVYGGVEASVADLMKLSRILPEMGKKGEVGVVGAVYELESGKVEFSEMVQAEHECEVRDPARLVRWGAVKQVARAK